MGNLENKCGRPAKQNENPFTEIFRKLIGEATQQEIANKVGVSRQNVGKWLTGTTTPDINTLCKIASAFNVSTDYLLGRTPNKTADPQLQAVCEYTGLSQKSAENIRRISQSGGDANILLERDQLNNIVELLKKIKIQTVSELFNKARSFQLLEIEKFFCNANKQMLEFIQKKYAVSILTSVVDKLKEADCDKHNEDAVIIWEYCLLQREMRKLLDDIESDKPEYKELFVEYDNLVEEHLKKTLTEKENELCNSTAKSNKELEQNIKALKQLIDYYHEHIRKGVTPNG